MPIDKTKFCHESNLIEGIDNHKADLQTDKAMAWLLTENEITSSTVRELHRMMLEGFETDPTVWNEAKYDIPSSTGHFRTCGVHVGGRSCPYWLKVPEMVSEWCKKWGETKNFTAEECLRSHMEYETIHPFADGNGRTGRLLMYWVFTKNWHEPPLFLNEEKHEKYYPLFR